MSVTCKFFYSRLIDLNKSQWQPQAVSAVKLSKVIFRAYFSHSSLKTRSEKLENFFDAIRLFKDAEFISHSESFFEIFEHGQNVLDHP